MIKKIKTISNIAVFQDFKWDESVVGDDQRVVEFKKINILYGRNYSGKTTLSRIFRALEMGFISDKYDNPQFCILFDDSKEITLRNIRDNNKIIRVFNEDFVKENLRFIYNPDAEIESFAISLGDDNNKIEEEINTIKLELGSTEEGKETGLYAKKKSDDVAYRIAETNYNKANNSLESQLKAKATNNPNGIKYQSDKFGDQNYSIIKLKSDISIIRKSGFSPISNEKQNELLQLLKEQTKSIIPELPKIKFSFATLSDMTKELVSRKVGASEKIEELVRDTVLNRWVKDGRSLHKGKRIVCAFCGNQISEDRWRELDEHFDEESDKLEKEIDCLIEKIKQEQILVNNSFKIDKNEFYLKFHTRIDKLISQYEEIVQESKMSTNGLIVQLQTRKNYLINPRVFEAPTDYSQKVNDLFEVLDNLCKESNTYSSLLLEEQSAAKNDLRLREVFDFIATINYGDLIADIDSLNESKEKAEKQKCETAEKIQQKETLIEAKKRQINDEEKGAIKVNEYLNNFFGNQFLSLQAVKQNFGEKQFKFEVIRNGQKAYHLSEGECSLIAFCYFMAKLDGVDTKGKKPIIWIDDPISSLDSNHIFFVYSLIAINIADSDEFDQLFISTHNLDFLKYLKRMNGKFLKLEKEKAKEYFIINRVGPTSLIERMPKYLKEHITEFNYLFNELYKCSLINRVDDSNYSSFYNFGNNARKFLEIYLFYKYPDDSEDRKKMENFFGEGKIPVILTERINNEYSHLQGCIERASFPIDVPEMNSIARQITSTIEQQDKKQYDALLKSIGVNPKITL